MNEAWETFSRGSTPGPKQQALKNAETGARRQEDKKTGRQEV